MKYRVILRNGSEASFDNAPDAAKAYFLEEYGKVKTADEPYLPDLQKIDESGTATHRAYIAWAEIAQPVKK